MSVTFDAVGPSSTAASSTSSTTLSWSHTCGGSATYLQAGCQFSASSDTGLTLAATYNGVSMTQIAKVQANNGGQGWLYVWEMVNPPTGAADTVLVTCSGGTPVLLVGGSISFNGAGQSGTPATTENASTPAVTVSSTTSGNMVAAWGGLLANTSITPASSPFTDRVSGNHFGPPSIGFDGATASSTGSSMTCTFGSQTGWNGCVGVEVQAGGTSVNGAVSALALAAPAGIPAILAPGPVANLALAAPAGTPAGSGAATVAGAVAGLALAAPAGQPIIVGGGGSKQPPSDDSDHRGLLRKQFLW